MRIIIVTFIAAILPNAAQSLECKSAIKAHGLITYGAMHCNMQYKHDSSFINRSNDCRDLVSPDEHKKMLIAGMEDFDNFEKHIGNAKACALILKKFKGHIFRTAK